MARRPSCLILVSVLTFNDRFLFMINGKCVFIILLSLFYAKASDIQSDVENIIQSEYHLEYKLILHKHYISDSLKTQIEKRVRQKFFSDYVYIWEICGQDSLSGFAVLDNVLAKSLPITFLVIFSPNGQIKKVDIIRYREPYGGAVGSRIWLDQFTRKPISDDFMVYKDIDAISGATISTGSVTRGVYKLMLMMEYYISTKVYNCSENISTTESNAN